MSNKRACPYKTLDGQSEGDGDFSSITIENITIQSPNTLPTYTLTLPQNDGNAGQILSTNGSGVLAWVNDSVGTGTVTSVSVTVPSYQTVTVLNSTTTPAIQISGSATGTGIVALQTQPFFTDFIGISADYFTNPGLAEVLKLRSDENIAQEIKISFAKNAVKNEFGFYFDPANAANNYYYVTVGTKSLLFMGLASFTFPTTTGSAGQVLSTDGFGNTSWVTRGTVTSVSVTVPSYQTVTVLNSTTTPTIQISGSATGTGIVALQTQPFFTDFIGISSDFITNPGLAEVLKLRNDENIAQEIKVTFAKNLVKNEFGFYFDPANSTNNYYYVTVGSKSLLFTGYASFTFPTTTGSAGQVLSTDGFGNTSWVSNGGSVTSVSASVPSWLSVTVSNPTTTPAIAITGSSTGTGTVSVLQDSPTINNTLTVSDKIDIPRNNANGEAIRIHNANTSFPNDDYVAIGHNSSARNHAHFGHTIVANNDPNNYAYIETNSNRFIFNGLANFKLPITTGTAGQALITDGSGNTSWTTVGTVTSVSATVPAWLSVTVTNPTTTPAIAITGSSTGTGTVTVLQNSPTINTVIFLENTGGVNVGSTLTLRDSTDVYIRHWSPGSSGLLANAFAISTGSASVASNNYFYAQNGKVGIFNNTPVETFEVTGTIGVSSYLKLNNLTLYGTLTLNTLYLPTTPGTNGQVLTSTGSGTAMTWTTPATGTVTSVSATSPLASSGGATPTISISSSTGTGAVVLQDSPTITTGLTISVPTTGNVGLTVTNSSRSYLLSTSLSNQFQIRDVTGNAQRMVINSSGNIGFGTSPNTSYRILAGQGAIGAVGSGSNNITVIAQTAPGNASFRSINDTRTYSIGVRGDTNDVFAITDDTASAFRMVIDTSGNVGIGTISPFVKFLVEGAPQPFGIQYLSSTATLSSTINTIDILQRWYESTGNASYIDLSWIRTSTGSNWFSAGQRFQAKTDGEFQAYIQFNGNNNYGLSFGTGFAATAHGVAERMRITDIGNVGIGTTSPSERFHVANGQMQVTQAGTGVTAISKIVAGTIGNASVANEAHLYFQTIGGGGGLVTNSIIGKYALAFGYHLLATADTFVTSGPIALNSTVTLKIAPASSTFDFILPSSPGTAGQYLISGGAGAAMYWGSGGGGGGGSVNSVTASAPLSSSGGTAPNISIASATGTGSVVLAQTPLFVSGFSISENSTDTMGPITCGNGQFLSIEAHNGLNTVKRPIVLNGYGGSVAIGITNPTQRLTVAGNTQLTFDSANNDGFRHFGANNTTHLISLTRQTNDACISGFEGVRFMYNCTTSPSSGSVGMRINVAGDVGIGTTSPTSKLDVNGAITVNGESKFSNGTYSDPIVGVSYIAKFGSTTGNGIAVRGNSWFTATLRADNFTTNNTDFLQYVTYDCPANDVWVLSGSPTTGAFGLICQQLSSGVTYNSRLMKVVQCGRQITVIFDIDFNYSAGGGTGIMVLRVPSGNGLTLRYGTANVNNYGLTAQGVCNYPTNIAGIANPMTVAACNISYGTGFPVVLTPELGLLLTTSTDYVRFNNVFGQANQRIYGSVTYMVY